MKRSSPSTTSLSFSLGVLFLAVLAIGVPPAHGQPPIPDLPGPDSTGDADAGRLPIIARQFQSTLPVRSVTNDPKGVCVRVGNLPALADAPRVQCTILGNLNVRNSAFDEFPGIQLQLTEESSLALGEIKIATEQSCGLRTRAHDVLPSCSVTLMALRTLVPEPDVEVFTTFCLKYQGLDVPGDATATAHGALTALCNVHPDDRPEWPGYLWQGFGG